MSFVLKSLSSPISKFQSDKIGRIFKVLGGKNSYKSSLNDGQLFGQFWKTSLVYKLLLLLCRQLLETFGILFTPTSGHTNSAHPTNRDTLKLCRIQSLWTHFGCFTKRPGQLKFNTFGNWNFSLVTFDTFSVTESTFVSANTTIEYGI